LKLQGVSKVTYQYIVELITYDFYTSHGVQLLWVKTQGVTRTPQNFPRGGTNAFVSPPTFVWHKINLLSSSSVLLFFYYLKLVIINLGWNGGGSAPQHFLQRETNAFPNFCMTQSQSSVVKFNFLFFYHLKSVIAKSRGRERGHISLTFIGGIKTFVLQLFHAIKLIFCQQAKFFYIFEHLKSVITNLEWMERGDNHSKFN